jgi:dethiobiotin synthetase
MKHRYFITATGTNIGKTFITCALARQAKTLGNSVAAYKPLLTGCDVTKAESSDTGMLLQSLGLPTTPENIDRISPWRYKAPLAPSMAARLENRTLDVEAVVAWSRKVADGPEDIILIEGVGGVMVPMDDDYTVLDWTDHTRIPALLVTGSYLGTISHTLTALAVLEQRQILVAGIIVNESENSSVTLTDTADEIKRWARAPVIAVKRRKPGEWKNVSELEALLK